MHLPALSLTGARWLSPEGLRDGPLHLAGGRIVAEDPGGRRLDLSGAVILPGIVDAHGDGFERHFAPRRGAQTDPARSLAALDTELGANGITTAMLAQFWSWEGGMRGPDSARTLVETCAATPTRTDLHVQLRLELGCFDTFDAARALIAAHSLRHVVFNDHLPHAALAAGRTPPRLQGQALKAGRAPEAHLALLRRMHERMPEVRAALPAFCADLRESGILLGSHDDDTPEARAAWRALGARIAEFPVSRATAEAARAAGDAIVLGAPNLMRGGSHKSKHNVSAGEMVAAGLCDALASDYHYPAPLAAMRKLVATGAPLPEAWPLVSSGPAALLGLTDRGRLAPGLRADLIVAAPDLATLHATFAAGRVSWLSGALADRLLQGG